MDVEARVGIKEASISAVVIRADGTREDLGVISRWHRNPFKRLWWRIRHVAHR
jgi:hypothetical protein